MAGVVRRDGLREAERLELLIAEAAGSEGGWAGIARCLVDAGVRVLDAVPDVPPTEDCGNDCMTSEGHREGCPVHCGCYDVPPDPPAADRDELAREMAAGFHGDGRWEAAAADDGLNEGQRRVWLNIADRILSSGVLVDAADVRARALRWAASFGTFPGKSWPETLRYHADYIRDRAVSEREGTSRPPADTDTGRGQ